jgi:hypothetical protein
MQAVHASIDPQAMTAGTELRTGPIIVSAQNDTAVPVAVSDLVLYRLSDDDVNLINAEDPTRYHRNPVYAGQQYPAVVTATFGGPSTANLHVILDGITAYWATSRPRGDAMGQWQYRTA